MDQFSIPIALMTLSFVALLYIANTLSNIHELLQRESRDSELIAIKLALESIRSEVTWTDKTSTAARLIEKLGELKPR